MNRMASAFIFLLVPGASQAADSAAAAYENGLDHYIAEDYKKSQKAFEQAIRADPDCADCHVWLGRAYGRLAETNSGLKIFSSYGLARKARASFQRAVDLDAKNIDALESLLAYYVEAPAIVGGSMAKAFEIAKQIEAVNRAEGARAWAVYYESKKNFPDAEAALKKARELEPDTIGHLLGHASFLARRGRFEKADELFDDALECEPDNPAVWFARAKAFIGGERKSRYDEARELLRRYLAAPLAAPDSEPHSKARKLLKKI